MYKNNVIMKDIILFDMDGTLFDTSEGITKCAQYALSKFGIQEKLEDLTCFIGPPLIEAFMERYDFTRETAKKAVEIFRERYSTKGVYECSEIAGARECITALFNQNKTLCVATCKPEKFANIILQRAGLSKYFDVVVGSEMDEKRTKKDEVIFEVFERLSEKNVKERCVMVGDREHDILGAKTCGIQSIGIKVGFAEEGELEKAGANYIVNNFNELLSLLLKI